MTTEAVPMPAAILPVETGNATRRFWNFVFYAVLTISAIIWIAPVYLLVSTAFKSALDFSTHGALALPSRIEWGNFAKAWDAGIISIVSEQDPISTVLLAIMAAGLRVDKSYANSSSSSGISPTAGTAHAPIPPESRHCRSKRCKTQ